MPRYPDIQVNLQKMLPKDPIWAVRLHLCWAKVPKAEQREFVQNAINCTADELLPYIKTWVTITG